MEDLVSLILRAFSVVLVLRVVALAALLELGGLGDLVVSVGVLQLLDSVGEDLVALPELVDGLLVLGKQTQLLELILNPQIES